MVINYRLVSEKEISFVDFAAGTANEVEFYFSKTQKGNDLLMYCGYEYTMNRRNKNGSTVWRCARRLRGCKAYVIYDTGVITVKKPHEVTVCFPDPIRAEVKKELTICYQRVAEEKMVPISNLYKDFINILKEKGDCYLKAAPSFATIKDTLYRIKKGKTWRGKQDVGKVQ